MNKMSKTENVTSKYRILCIHRLLIIALLLLVQNESHGQNTFENIYKKTGYEQISAPGYIPNFVKEDNNGNFLIGGGKTYTIETSISFLIKTDQNGDTIWTKNLIQNGCEGISYTNDEGFIFSATQGGWMSYGKGFLITKTDNNVNNLWSIWIGHNDYYNNNIVSGKHTVQLPDSSFVSVGCSRDNSVGASDIYITRTSSNGTFQWGKMFGSAYDEFGKRITLTHHNTLLLLSILYNGPFGGSEFVLTETDFSGNIIWSKLYGTSENDFPYDVIITDDNGIVICGYTYNGGYKDHFIVKTDSTGNIQWSKIMGGANNDYATSISNLNNNEFIFCGGFSNTATTSSVFAAKMNYSGDTVWTRCFVDTLYSCGYAISPTSDGGVIIGANAITSGHDYPVLIKTDYWGHTDCSFQPTGINVTPGSFIQVNMIFQTNSYGNSGINTFTIESAGAGKKPVCDLSSESRNSITLPIEISVYPNPFSNSTIISLNDNNIKIVSYELFDIFSRPIFNKYLIDCDSIIINANELPSGLYIIRVTTNENKSYICKIIKTNDGSF